ncbi:hypothetical protein CBOM_00599 [Ceraceosorus bombacis]|uniref:Uncharacterized protein n=1 Tax=Ceraceosorus bombacis TaxID=401625 RepID=A0A0P1BAG8_9BASI|nr:hypothetical protein CBOM_00599 [Ceraceosorus bombacis]
MSSSPAAAAAAALVEEQYHGNILRWVTLAFASVAIWEHIIWLPSELAVWKSLLRKLGFLKQERRELLGMNVGERLQATYGPVTMCIVRYALLLSGILAIVHFYGRPQSCFGVFRAMWLCFCVSWACASSIFVARIYIIYRKDTRILWGLGVLWIATVGVWIAIAFTYHSANVPNLPPHTPWCRPTPDPKWRATGWGMSMLFDTVVLLMTLLRLHHLQVGADSPQGRQMRRFILRSNLFWFIACFITNGACFIVELAVDDPILSHIPSPISFVANAIVAIRIVFDQNMLGAPLVAPDVFGEHQFSGCVNVTTSVNVSPPDQYTSRSSNGKIAPEDKTRSDSISAASGGMPKVMGQGYRVTSDAVAHPFTTRRAQEEEDDVYDYESKKHRSPTTELMERRSMDSGSAQFGIASSPAVAVGHPQWGQRAQENSRHPQGGISISSLRRPQVLASQDSSSSSYPFNPTPSFQIEAVHRSP